LQTLLAEPDDFLEPSDGGQLVEAQLTRRTLLDQNLDDGGQLKPAQDDNSHADRHDAVGAVLFLRNAKHLRFNVARLDFLQELTQCLVGLH